MNYTIYYFHYFTLETYICKGFIYLFVITNSHTIEYIIRQIELIKISIFLNIYLETNIYHSYCVYPSQVNSSMAFLLQQLYLIAVFCSIRARCNVALSLHFYISYDLSTSCHKIPFSTNKLL